MRLKLDMKSSCTSPAPVALPKSSSYYSDQNTAEAKSQRLYRKSHTDIDSTYINALIRALLCKLAEREQVIDLHNGNFTSLGCFFLRGAFLQQQHHQQRQPNRNERRVYLLRAQHARKRPLRVLQEYLIHDLHLLLRCRTGLPDDGL